ncbi:MAG: alpha/beta hydrolase [Bacteroidetes Order II. Incertae sedis bacterium]|nr:alpha/beta hydrolase [Bacteroidetes Order II. bacterium]
METPTSPSNTVAKVIRNSALALGAATVAALNALAYRHAHLLTRYVEAPRGLKKHPAELTSAERFQAALKGIGNPRPQNDQFPERPYKTIEIPGEEHTLEAWLLPAEQALGTVALFHGYTSKKSDLLDKALFFHDAGYEVILVDFSGSGGSGGSQTSIGYYEAHEVAAVCRYLEETSKSPIILFGTSMGAVAILKALATEELSSLKNQPRALILECPFGSMYRAVANRFENIGIPTFPVAALMVFWGGVQNGFWAFRHRPTDYAKRVSVPTLLIWGEKDPHVRREEVEAVYKNLAGPKQLCCLPHAAHSDFMLADGERWRQVVHDFMTHLSA